MGHMLKLNRETQASNWSYPIEPDGRVLGSKPSSLSQIKKPSAIQSNRIYL